MATSLAPQPSPDLAAPKSFWVELAPLKKPQVWRFALYYFFVFGGFVALALWLPRYLIGVYGFNIATAGMIGAAYSIPASVFRAYGGMLSDRIGARTVLYATFIVSAVVTLILSLPATDYVMRGIGGPISFDFEIGPIASYGDFIVKHRFRPPSFPVAGELQYLRDGCPRQPRIRWDLQSRTTIPVFGKKFRAAAPLFKTALFSGSWAIDGASRPLTGRGVTMSAPYAVLITAPSGITPSFA